MNAVAGTAVSVHEQRQTKFIQRKKKYIHSALFTQPQLLLRETKLLMAGIGEVKAKSATEMAMETKHFFMFHLLGLNYQACLLKEDVVSMRPGALRQEQ